MDPAPTTSCVLIEHQSAHHAGESAAKHTAEPMASTRDEGPTAGCYRYKAKRGVVLHRYDAGKDLHQNRQVEMPTDNHRDADTGDGYQHQASDDVAGRRRKYSIGRGHLGFLVMRVYLGDVVSVVFGISVRSAEKTLEGQGSLPHRGNISL